MTNRTKKREYGSQNDVEQQFATAIDWGRYVELFEYDAAEARLFLPQVQAVS